MVNKIQMRFAATTREIWLLSYKLKLYYSFYKHTYAVKFPNQTYRNNITFEEARYNKNDTDF